MLTSILLSSVTPYIIGLAALAGALWAYFFAKISLKVIIVGIVLAALVVAYTKGASDAGHVLEIEQLRAEKERIEAELAANKEIIKKYLADAAMDEAADAEREKLLKELLDRLAASGDGTCGLNRDDIDGVRKLHGR